MPTEIADALRNHPDVTGVETHPNSTVVHTAEQVLIGFSRVPGWWALACPLQTGTQLY